MTRRGAAPGVANRIAREFDHPPTESERVARRDHSRLPRHVLFRATGYGARGGFQGPGRLSRCGWRRIDDVDGRDRERGIHHRQFHRHERQSIRFQSVSRQPDHLDPARSRRIFRFGDPASRTRNNIGPPTDWPKAFWELDLDIPAVIRLGGNTKIARSIFRDGCRSSCARRSKAIAKPMRRP